MLKLLNKNLRRLSSLLKSSLRRRSKSKPSFDNPSPKPPPPPSKPIRIATFNAAFFSMAPVLPEPDRSTASDDDNVERPKSTYDRPPRSILKQSQSPPLGKSKLRVSINLPDNEISLRQTSFSEHERAKGSWSFSEEVEGERQRKTVLEVLREVNADVLGLQDVKAEEENGMKPLSDLARALGMNYVFAESWAPQYGNAVLSKWPIKRWKLQKIFDHTDFRSFFN